MYHTGFMSPQPLADCNKELSLKNQNKNKIISYSHLFVESLLSLKEDGTKPVGDTSET